MIHFWKILFFVVIVTILLIIGSSQVALYQNNLYYVKLSLQVLFLLCVLIGWWLYIVISELSIKTSNAIFVILDIKDSIQMTRKLIYEHIDNCDCEECIKREETNSNGDK
jgi:hypothetical protein